MCNKFQTRSRLTANDQMKCAVSHINELFGGSYAFDHPELVGDFMKTCALNYIGEMLALQNPHVLREVGYQ